VAAGPRAVGTVVPSAASADAVDAITPNGTTRGTAYTRSATTASASGTTTAYAACTGSARSHSTSADPARSPGAATAGASDAGPRVTGPTHTEASAGSLPWDCACPYA
jgi:hypothetical protein